MSLDGGFVYIAGMCGLVPVLAENYNSKWWGAPLCVFFPLGHEERRWKNHSLIHTTAATKLSLSEHLLLCKLWAPSSQIPTFILKVGSYSTFQKWEMKVLSLKTTPLQRTAGIPGSLAGSKTHTSLNALLLGSKYSWPALLCGLNADRAGNLTFTVCG